ncbi:MAG: hypothetical protein QXZ12_04400 [Thermoplasmata archaeon]
MVVKLMATKKIMTLFLLLLLVAISMPAVNSQSVPSWAFDGAYAQYSIIEHVNNSTSNSTILYTISAVDQAAQSFNVTMQSVPYSGTSISEKATFNNPAPFPAENITVLTALNAGRTMPGYNATTMTIKHITIKTAAGSFAADEVNYTTLNLPVNFSTINPDDLYNPNPSTANNMTMWVASSSGLIIMIIYGNITTMTLEKTNIGISSSSPLMYYIIIAILILITVFFIIRSRTHSNIYKSN